MTLAELIKQRGHKYDEQLSLGMSASDHYIGYITGWKRAYQDLGEILEYNDFNMELEVGPPRPSKIPWKIWFKTFVDGKEDSTKVYYKSFKHKYSAIWHAWKAFGKTSKDFKGRKLTYKWIVSQTNPWQKGENK